MKTLRLIAFAVAATTTACTANAGFITGRVLYDHMTSGVTARQLAATYYVAGVFDSYHQSTHCAPDGVTVKQVEDLLLSFLSSNQDLLKHPADVLGGFVFSQAWPCQTSKKKGGTV